jgi:hypothetical protein
MGVFFASLDEKKWRMDGEGEGTVTTLYLCFSPLSYSLLRTGTSRGLHVFAN